MDMVTGARVAVVVTVPVPRERMWDVVTDVGRIGEWSPEATAGTWCDGAQGPVPGARFIARNRFANGMVTTVTCVVTEAEPPSAFTWTVLDDSGQVGSMWSYELRDGGEPGTTQVHHSFTHGPGNSGARVAAAVDPRALRERLVTLCQNMTTTIAAMAAADTTMGATR
jgi:uncharacterized protein YndB with AHSA1/START domain